MNPAYKLLALVLIVAGLVFGGYRWGARATDNAWKAKEVERLQAERDQREAERRRGEKASADLGIELRDLAINNDQLQGAFNAYKRHHPILAIAPVRPASTTAAGDGAAPGSGDGGDGPRIALTRGAVWMWNSALIGRDVPAGACGLADSSAAACAIDSGVSVEDAWDNQALNARICAEDRARHQRLIDFINGGKK